MWRRGKRGRPPEYRIVKTFNNLKEARAKVAKLQALGIVSKVCKSGYVYHVYKKIK